MQLKNSTDFPNHLLRRMVSWCAKQVDYPSSRIRKVEFRNRTRRSYSGHAYGSRDIVVSIGPATLFPTRPDMRPGMSGEVMVDRLEALVSVTAHELAHLHQYANRRASGLARQRKTEFDARWHEVQALRKFREQREALLAEWSVSPAARPAKPRSSIVEKRAAAAAAALAYWNSRLKAAQTKVRKYKARVRYYERSAAKKSLTQSSNHKGSESP